MGYKSTLWRLVMFMYFRVKTTRSHVALCNLGAESGRELFKGSKDVGPNC